jgi:intracellular sulfur oxidation DsrE/DsrF family protein
MSRYLLVESRNPYTSCEISGSTEHAVTLKRRGHDVALLLVQNGVQPLRHDAKAPALHAALAAGVEVLADEFALRERGISAGALVAGVRAVPPDTIIDRLVHGWTTLWR